MNKLGANLVLPHKRCSASDTLPVDVQRGTSASDNESITTIVLCTVFLIFSLTPIAQEASNKPDGVHADNWVAITEKFGFVITADKPLPVMDQTLLLDTPIEGYFVIRGGHGWVRITMNDTLQRVPSSR